MTAAGHQRGHRPAGEVADECAVLGRRRRRGRVGEQGALLVEVVLHRFGNGDFLTRRELAEDEIGTRVLALLARAATARPLRRLGPRRRRGTCAGAAAGSARAAPGAAASAARAAHALVVREPCGGLLGHPEAADLLDGRHLPARQGHDAEARLWLARCRRTRALAARGLAAALLARRTAAGLAVLLLVGLALRDREDDEGAVLGEHRPGASPVRELLAGFEVAHDELAVLGLRRRGVGEPLTVVREAGALDGTPVVDDIVRERALDGRLRLHRRGRLRLRLRLCGDDPLAGDDRAHDEREQPCQVALTHKPSSTGDRTFRALFVIGGAGAAAPTPARNRGQPTSRSSGCPAGNCRTSRPCRCRGARRASAPRASSGRTRPCPCPGTSRR